MRAEHGREPPREGSLPGDVAREIARQTFLERERLARDGGKEPTAGLDEVPRQVRSACPALEAQPRPRAKRAPHLRHDAITSPRPPCRGPRELAGEHGGQRQLVHPLEVIRPDEETPALERSSPAVQTRGAPSEDRAAGDDTHLVDIWRARARDGPLEAAPKRGVFVQVEHVSRQAAAPRAPQLEEQVEQNGRDEQRRAREPVPGIGLRPGAGHERVSSEPTQHHGPEPRGPPDAPRPAHDRADARARRRRDGAALTLASEAPVQRTSDQREQRDQNEPTRHGQEPEHHRLALEAVRALLAVQPGGQLLDPPGSKPRALAPLGREASAREVSREPSLTRIEPVRLAALGVQVAQMGAGFEQRSSVPQPNAHEADPGPRVRLAGVHAREGAAGSPRHLVVLGGHGRVPGELVRFVLIQAAAPPRLLGAREPVGGALFDGRAARVLAAAILGERDAGKRRAGHQHEQRCDARDPRSGPWRAHAPKQRLPTQPGQAGPTPPELSASVPCTKWRTAEIAPDVRFCQTDLLGICILRPHEGLSPADALRQGLHHHG